MRLVQTTDVLKLVLFVEVVISGRLLSNDRLPEPIKNAVMGDKPRDIPRIDQGCNMLDPMPYAAYNITTTEEYGNKTEVHRCKYYECLKGEYTLKSCPDGLGVSRKLIKKGFETSYPCSKRTKKCRNSLSEKGVGDVRVEGCGPDIIWVIDMSCSITTVNKRKVRDFVTAVIRRTPAFPPFAQFGALTFASGVYDALYMNSYNKQSDILTAIKRMKTRIPKRECGTATWLALQSARETHLSKENGNRPDRADIVIVMTDGRSSPPENWMKTVEQARLLREAADKVILVELPNASAYKGSLKEQLERKRLAEREFSEIPTDKVKDRYSLNSFDDLDELIQEMASLSCFKL